MSGISGASRVRGVGVEMSGASGVSEWRVSGGGT